MKLIVIAALLSLSAASFAKGKTPTNILELVVKTAKFDPRHVKNAGPGKVTVNYSEKIVKLFVPDVEICPKGMICTEALRVLSVELPIKSVQKDDCGIFTVTALRDLRPVDGVFEKLTVTDVTNMTCKPLVAVDPQAIYETRYYDRMGGKEVHAISKMVLGTEGQITKPSTSILLKYQINIGFSPDPAVETLTIDSEGKVLSSTEYFKTKEKTLIEVAQLSHIVLNRIIERIKTIPAETKLVDDQEGGPICMDAPSSFVSLFSEGIEIRIYENQGCHISKSFDGEATSLTALILGLVAISH